MRLGCASLYEGWFRELGQLVCAEPLSIATDERITINLNLQRGSAMRYECHVDSNPLEGLLYVTDHPPGTGGELVVSHRLTARTVPEVDESAAIVYPRAGHLLFFDARQRAHYVRSLTSEDAVRVVVAMNFYTPSCPESSRPPDLNRHLFGDVHRGQPIARLNEDRGPPAEPVPARIATRKDLHVKRGIVLGACKPGIGEAVTRRLVTDGFSVLGTYEEESTPTIERLSLTWVTWWTSVRSIMAGCSP